VSDNEHELSYTSTHGQEYTVLFQDYSGKDYSTVCFVFPGQSSAQKGMFRSELQEFEEFQSLFARADEFAAYHDLVKPSCYITSPHTVPDEQLTIIRTLCLFVAEYALFQRLKNQGLKPSILTGHSFGEFAAIAASGSVDFVDMLEIVLLREQSCPAPHRLGYLLTVFSTFASISKVLESSYFEVACYNSPDQVVIGIPGLDEVKAAEALLKDAGIHFRRMDHVPQPYHTSLMKDCAERFTRDLSAYPLAISPPLHPFHSSVLQTRIDNQNFHPSRIRSAITRHLVEPLDFISQITAIYQGGMHGFIEVGPGTVFSKLIAEILRGKSHSIVPLTHFLCQEKGLVKKYSVTQSKLLRRVSSIISRLTGYELQHIKIRKKLQDDLGIDSLKKAEILLVLEDEGMIDAASIASSAIKTTADLGEAVVKASYARLLATSLSLREPDFQRHRLVEKEFRVSRLFLREEEKGRKIIHLSLSALLSDFEGESSRAFELLREGINPLIILVFDLVEEGDPVEMSMRFLTTIKALLPGLPQPFQLIALAGREGFLFTAAGSFFKSLRKEGDCFSFSSVIHQDDTDLSTLAREAAQEVYHVDLRYKKGSRYALVMEPEELSTGEECRDFKGSVLLAVGGAHGITLSLLKHLVADNELIVAIVGRSSPEERAPALASLRCGKGEITYHRGDASHFDEVLSIAQKVYDQYGKIDYIVSGAGCQVSALFSGRSDGEIRSELACTLTIAQNLLRIGERFKVRKIAWFSSIVAWAGNQGQAVYSFANSALNYMACTSRVPVLSIMWPPWKGIGMMDDEALMKRMRAFGISLLDEERAFPLFQKDLFSSRSTGCVLYHDRADTPLYWGPLLPLNDFESLLGTFIYHRDISFQQDITAESHPFLKHPESGGGMRLPFAYMAALLLFQSSILTGTMGRIEDFTLGDSLTPGNGAVVACHYDMREKNCLMVTINSLQHGCDEAIPLGRCLIHYPEQGIDHLHECSLSDFASYKQSLHGIDAEKISRNQGTEHGLHGQAHFFLDEEGHYVASLPPSLVNAHTGCHGFDRVLGGLALVMDLAAFSGRGEGRMASPPDSLLSLHVDDSRSWEGALFARITAVHKEKDHIRVDAAILSDDGACLARLFGIAIRTGGGVASE
jgi:malonyl CoA-acyl carrier protein transacylase